MQSSDVNLEFVANLVDDLRTIVPPVMYKSPDRNVGQGGLPLIEVGYGTVYENLTNITQAALTAESERASISLALFLGGVLMYFFFLSVKIYSSPIGAQQILRDNRN
jgi:hypothetical protein